MQFLNGFFFTCGAITAFIFSLNVILLIVKRKRKPQKAPALIWRNYLTEIVKDNKFTEAAFITKLIVDKKDHEEVETPTGYKVQADKSLVIDENEGEGLSKIKVHTTLKIIKTINHEGGDK